MRVFLTGGTGFIGQALTKVLLARGWAVSVLVRNPNSVPAKQIAGMGATLVQGDVLEVASMRQPMQQADVVIHNAGLYELGADAALQARMTEVNVQGTKNTLNLARELNVAKIIHISTIWALGDSGATPRDETFMRNTPILTAYERSKTEAHNFALELQRSGAPLSIICPSAVIGTNDHSVFGYLLRLYVQGLLPPLAWSPDVFLTLVDIRDLVEGIALVVEKGKAETYFLCGQTHTRRDMLEIWQTQAGGAKFRAYLPVPVMKAMFMLLEPVQRAIGLPAVFSRDIVDAGRVHLNYVADKAVRELGWSFRSARDMWVDAIKDERELVKQRSGFVKKLNPLEVLP